MKGRLQDRSLAATLDELQNRTSSGVLTLERGQTKKQICFLKGLVRFAASNLREDRLGEFLIAAGVVPSETIRRAEEEIAKGSKLGELLISWNVMTTDDVRDYVRAHVLNLVVPCLSWRDGQYRFQEGVPNIVGEVATDVPVVEILLEHERRGVSEAQIKKCMLIDRNRTPVLSANRARSLARVKTTQPESFFLAQVESGMTLERILALSPGSESDVARAAAVLSATGVVSFVQPSASADTAIYDTKPPALKGKAVTSSEPAALPAEILYYRQMHDLLLGMDAYKTLSVETDATTEQIRRAYYALAKEIHPDRFLSPPLDVLHAEMEELFAQVLEAYNTLIDPESRVRYDAERQAAAPTPKPAADQQTLARQNFVRGRMLFDEGKMAEALGFLQNAVDGDPNRPEYLRLLGKVQARNPRLRSDAETSFLRAIKLDPARAETYLHLGLLYRRMGETQKAILHLQECLKWDAANLEAGAALAEMGAPLRSP